MRRRTSVVIDEVVLDAAVAVVGESGTDDVNLSAVARTAGLTTGAVYSRYENRQEILVDVWQKRAAGVIREVIDLGVRITQGDSEAASLAADLLRRRDRRAFAGLALLIAAPRVDELQESLLPEMRAWFDESPEGKAANASLPMIGFLLGAIGFDSALSAPARDWDRPLSWGARGATPPPVEAEREAGDSTDLLVDLIRVDTGDEVQDRLLRSMAAIVARSGLKRATTSRVARAAGFSQSAVFDIWPTRDDLVREFSRTVLHGMVSSTSPLGSPAPAGDSAGASLGLTSILGPSFRLLRRLRLEFALAAMSDRVVADVVRESDEEAVSALVQHSVDPRLRILAESQRALVLGLILLEETVGHVGSRDFSTPIGTLLASAFTD